MNILMYLNLKSLLIELLIISAVSSAILVIISKNPVISVIFLISLVLNSALFLMVKGMPFLGISYILIYLGAIIVLFLFVIMMINIKLTDILETGYQYTKNIPLALVVSGLFLYEIFNILPSYLNSPVISLDSSILLSLSKEVILSLNSFFIHSLSILGLAPAVETVSSIINNSHNSLVPLSLAEADILSRSASNSSLLTNNNWAETLIGNSQSAEQIVSVAYNLYTYGAFLFILLGMILLLSMIAPIYLSKK